MRKIICSVTGIEYPSIPCPSCNGRGEVPTGRQALYGMAHQPCQECRGDGVKLAPVSDPRWVMFDIEFDQWSAAKAG